MGRIEILCSHLTPCGTFADVGCDHGYCTQYMLKNGLCKSAVISDVSAKSLSKAEKLLKKYIDCGICRPVCCDGLQKIDKDTDLVLIAGMGGEEIVKILKEGFIPKAFVFQPIHNEADLRAYLVQSGCLLQYDGIFFSGGKYYFTIKGTNSGGSGNYSPAALAYGKDSLGTIELKHMLGDELGKINGYLAGQPSEHNRALLTQKAQFIQGVLNGEYT